MPCIKIISDLTKIMHKTGIGNLVMSQIVRYSTSLSSCHAADFCIIVLLIAMT